MRATPQSRAYWHQQWGACWDLVKRCPDPMLRLTLTTLLRLTAHTAALADEWPAGYAEPARPTVPMSPGGERR